MRSLDEKQLLEELWRKGEPLAVFLHTPFCGTCKVARRMLEVAEHLLPEGLLAEADVNMTPTVVEQYKIRSVPSPAFGGQGAERKAGNHLFHGIGRRLVSSNKGSAFMITMRDVSLRREENQILDHVSLNIRKGENWVILGRNGSGKTTILEMLTGYLFPSSGRIEVLGNVYGECDVREVRKEIGYISPSLLEKLNLSDPVWEVVATGAYAFLRFYQEIPEDVKDKALKLLEEMNLGKLSYHPLGTLSQGERKKVMLARSLMSEPKLLIMDEPCAGLDLYEREKMLAEVERLGERDITVVYVTHHVEEIMPLFSHVALIRDGKIAGSGPKQEVLNDEMIKQTYDIPARIEWDGGLALD